MKYSKFFILLLSLFSVTLHSMEQTLPQPIRVKISNMSDSSIYFIQEGIFDLNQEKKSLAPGEPQNVVLQPEKGQYEKLHFWDNDNEKIASYEPSGSTPEVTITILKKDGKFIMQKSKGIQ